MTRSTYSRVYHTAPDDARFEHVWNDDAALAGWLRLLVIADAAWPAAGTLPMGTKPRALKTLVDAGLVELLDGHRYRIHGMDAERETRAQHAKVAADAKWEQVRRGPTADPDAPSIPPGSAPGTPSSTLTSTARTMPSRAEQEQRRERAEQEPPDAPDDDGRVAYFEVTGRYPSSSNLSAWVDRLAADFGSDAFRAALATEHMADSSTRTLLSRTESRLAMDRDRRERRERAAKQRESRKPVQVLQSKPVEPELTPEEIDRQMRDYQAGIAAIKAEGAVHV